MKAARLAVLGIALLAGGAAAWLAAGPGEAPPAPAAPTPVPAMKLAEVLVTAADIPLGAVVTDRDVRWQSWPADAVGPGMLTRTELPNAPTEIAGSIARAAFFGGEPVRREKLVKGDGSGFMAAILPEGMRALAITIDNRGANTAGGFILPNDRVDVVRTYRDDAATRQQGGDVLVSETVLQNVRVLAIGQNVQEKNGEKVVVGETATLELSPGQVEQVALAQRVGQLSLSLRSMADRAKSTQPVADQSLTVVRYGVAMPAARR